MHVAIDAVGIKHSGGAKVLLDILNAALHEPQISRITLFCSPLALCRFELPESNKLYVQEQVHAEQSYLARVWWSQVELARKTRQVEAQVVFCMAGVGRSATDTPHVTMIQQSLPFSKEALACYGPGVRTYLLLLKQLMRSSCRSAKRIIVQTPTMKNWVSEQFRIAHDRIYDVLPSGQVDSQSLLIQSAKIRDNPHVQPTILYVGNSEPYKNVKTVIEGIELLRRSLPDVILQVTWPTDHPMNRHAAVECLGFLAKEELIQVYQHAAIVVMPSLVETVGLPMMEAMSMGIPVLAADRPYAHDICEDAALYFDPLSVDDFVQKSSGLLSDHQLRDDLAFRGRALVIGRLNSRPNGRMLNLVMSAGTYQERL